MSKRYTDDYKKVVCQLLKTNGGSVALTSRQTSVPPRTIREWRRQYPHLPPQINTRRQQPFAEQLQTLRERMIDQSLLLTAAMPAESDPAALNHRVMALTRLLDRLMRLDTVYPPPQTKDDVPIFRIVYTDEHGKEYDSPPDAEDEED